MTQWAQFISRIWCERLVCSWWRLQSLTLSHMQHAAVWESSLISSSHRHGIYVNQNPLREIRGNSTQIRVQTGLVAGGWGPGIGVLHEDCVVLLYMWRRCSKTLSIDILNIRCGMDDLGSPQTSTSVASGRGLWLHSSVMQIHSDEIACSKRALSFRCPQHPLLEAVHLGLSVTPPQTTQDDNTHTHAHTDKTTHTMTIFSSSLLGDMPYSGFRLCHG